MLKVWITVSALQAVIFLASMFVGMLVLRLRFWTCFLATALVLPVPVFQASRTGDTSGWIFAADVVAVICFVKMLVSRPNIDPDVRMQYRRLLYVALLIALLLPAFSTVVGAIMSSDPRNHKHLAVGLVRGLAYWVTFRTFILVGLREAAPARILSVQCFAFWLVSLCGLVQYSPLEVELDLFSQARGFELHEEFFGGFGGGYMGMYRGAVGAWSAGILGIVPVVLSRRRWGVVLMPIMATTILGGLLAVGSRQGIMIGSAAFLIGLLVSVRGMPAGYRAGAFFRGAGGVVALGIVAVLAWQTISPVGLHEYVANRFDILADPAELIYKIKHRDPDHPMAVKIITSNPHVFLIGTGLGTTVKKAADVHGLQRQFVDGEFLFVWQLGGVVIMIGYALFMILMRVQLRRRFWPDDLERRLAVSAAIVPWYVGLMLMYGHYFILTTEYFEAPVAHWNWAVFGMAVGIASATRAQIARAGLPTPDAVDAG